MRYQPTLSSLLSLSLMLAVGAACTSSGGPDRDGGFVDADNSPFDDDVYAQPEDEVEPEDFVESEDGSFATAHVNGNLQVSPDTEWTFLYQDRYIRENNKSKRDQRILYAVPDPEALQDGAWVMRIQKLDPTDENLRIIFPKGHILTMGQPRGENYEELALYDVHSLQQVWTARTTGNFTETRLSPSRRYLSVASIHGDKRSIQIIDIERQRLLKLPYETSGQIEASWLPGRDDLIVTLEENANLRVLSWAINESFKFSETDNDGKFWARPLLDLKILDHSLNKWLSHSAIGRSPDGRYVAFPVRGEVEDTSLLVEEGSRRKEYRQSYKIALLDTQTTNVRMIEDAMGPVAFTPDSSTLVAYHIDESRSTAPAYDPSAKRYPDDPEDISTQPLLLFDVETLEERREDFRFYGLLSFFVTASGDRIVVTSNNTDYDELHLYDMESGRSTTSGQGLELKEFVDRSSASELWLLDQGLWRVDYENAVQEKIELDWEPDHISILPQHDYIVLDQPREQKIHFIDPATAELAAEVPLPREDVRPRAPMDSTDAEPEAPQDSQR